MKKFLLYLLVLVVSCSFIGLIFYLTRDDETIKANSSVIYINKGEVAQPEYHLENEKKSTKVKVVSSNENVIKIENNEMIAVGRGECVVSVTISNARKVEQVVRQTVFVGDGSADAPFYIRNELDLLGIGSTYGADKHFKQVKDVTLTQMYNSQNLTFSGVYNGQGYKILGYRVEGDKENSALFKTISASGVVAFVNFVDVEINGWFDYASVVAKENLGLIDYVNVTGSIINKESAGICAGITAINRSSGGATGQIQRCVTKVKIKTSGCVIGGIAGINSGVVTSCQNGDTNLSNPYNCDFIFEAVSGQTLISGGIVGKNVNVGEATVVGNNYSVNQVVVENQPTASFFGGVVGSDSNDDLTPVEAEYKTTKNIFGNYYLIKSENDLFKRGIGNISTTTPNKDKNLYIAYGLTYEAFNRPDSILVSYATSFSGKKEGLTSWPTDVWVLDQTVFPYLIPAEKIGFSPMRLNISLPIASIDGSFEIDSLEKFVLYAGSDMFTSPSNAGKTYYITTDLDFSQEDFIMTGTEANPICVNISGVYIDGKYPTIKNMKINSSTAFRKDGTSATANDATSVGLFGVVSGVTIENLYFNSCYINDGTMNNAKYMGMVAGTAINSSIKGCVVLSSNGIGSVNGGVATVGMGSVVGFGDKVKIDSCYSDITLSSTSEPLDGGDLYAGGIIGILGGAEEAFTGSITSASESHILRASSYVNSSTFDGTLNFASSVYNYFVGGCAGIVKNGTDVNGFRGNCAINANYGGGIASICNGIVEQSAVVSTLNAYYGGGYVYKIDGSNSRIYNSYCETTFTQTGAVVNAGMACETGDGSYMAQCVNFNIFNNESSSNKNFARTKADLKVEFNANGKIDEMNLYNSTKSSEGTRIFNCFYVNQVNNADSRNTGLVKFYTTSGNYPNALQSIYVSNYVDETTVLTTHYNGKIGSGRLNSEGGLVTCPNGDIKWTDFGFSTNLWTNAVQQIKSSNLLYIA